MAITDILEVTPEFGFQESIEFKTLIDESESGDEVRDAAIDDGLREFNMTVRHLSKQAMDTIWNFYVARKGSYDDFLIKIITDFQEEDEIVGYGDGLTRQFLLNKFPVDISENNSSTIDGVSTSAYVLSNDTANEKSYITFNSAPALGAQLLVTYEFYHRVRFKEDKFSRSLMQYNLLDAGIILTEVRWNTYFPYSGNFSSSSSSSSNTVIPLITRWFGAFQAQPDANNNSIGSSGLAWNGITHINQIEMVRKIIGQVTTQMVITKMMIYLDTAPGIGKKRTFTLYQNDQRTGLRVSISGLNKTATVISSVGCQNGDFVYMREDQINTPANSNINIGYSVITGDARRQPIIASDQVYNTRNMPPLGGAGLNAEWSFAGDAGARIPYFASFGGHSLIPANGVLRNLQIRSWRNQTLYNSATAKSYAQVTLQKAVGSNNFSDTGLYSQIANFNLRAQDPWFGTKRVVGGTFFAPIYTLDLYRKSVPVSEGDLVTYDGFWFGNAREDNSINSFSTAAAHPVMKAIDFIPDTPKQGIYGFTLNGSQGGGPGSSANVDSNTHIHAGGYFKELTGVKKETFTLFSVAGVLHKMIIWCKGIYPVAGFPLTFTIRKNGVNTSHVITVTNIALKQTLDVCLRIEEGDRISIILSVPGQAPTFANQREFFLSWVFIPDNGGEWPLFGNQYGSTTF